MGSARRSYEFGEQDGQKSPLELMLSEHWKCALLHLTPGWSGARKIGSMKLMIWSEVRMLPFVRLQLQKRSIRNSQTSGCGCSLLIQIRTDVGCVTVAGPRPDPKIAGVSTLTCLIFINMKLTLRRNVAPRNA